MRLKSFELRRQKQMHSSKQTQKMLQSKRLEYRLEIELMDKLKNELEENDSVFIEVNPQAIEEFLNIVTGKVERFYAYHQVDTNKFIFYNREIEL